MAHMPDWFKRDGATLFVRVHAQPGARLSKDGTIIQGLHGDALKIRVAALPVDGRANEELIRFLAEKFVVPANQVTLLNGGSSRLKRFQIVASRVNPISLLEPVKA